ncbi:RHS repeat domain-containing protein, partial [uncultured Algibacter sp.]|uniref:RHS repeat domain-containing protein n=1 Tax=uncultured Algibacter sp. TaxID=298659 RepID=UPI00261A1721
LSYSDSDNDGHIDVEGLGQDLDNDGIVQENEIIEENNYYPFGGSHKGYNNVVNGVHHPYGYSGKEEQDELGLQWMDFGARNYDKWLGRWMNVDPAADVLESSSPYVYALNSPIVYLDLDGELPILINGKVEYDSERGDESYWTSEIIATIKGSGIANPGGQIHYVDGDRGYGYSYKSGGYATKRNALGANSRYNGGYKAAEKDIDNIIAKLERDPETGKITEKIQIYTHSRGAAFGAGYTSRLLRYIRENSELFADPNNVIDFVLNLAPHQSNSIDSPDGVDAYSIDRGYDMLSGDDMSGLKGAFKSNSEKGKFGESHRIRSFKNDLKSFMDAFTESKGDNTKLINGFIEKMKAYGIKVTVKE